MENIIQEQVNEREMWPMVDPITIERIEELKRCASQNLGRDFSDLPVSIERPGSRLFDYHEAQNKLYKKSGSKEAYLKLLQKHSITLSEANQFKLREIAHKEGINLDDTFDGFVWNIGGHRIMYVPIRKDRVLDMALKYKKKELSDRQINTTEEARAYITELSDKYFYHEIGHTVFKLAITEKDKKGWIEFVMGQEGLQHRVGEVQEDKHITFTPDLIAEEVFADMMVETAGSGFKNRLGNYPAILEMQKEILRRNDFKV